MNIITREELEEDLYGCLDTAIISYNDYVIATFEHSFNGIQVEVYKLLKNQDCIDRNNCKMECIFEKYGFEDTGHAMEWALNKIK